MTMTSPYTFEAVATCLKQALRKKKLTYAALADRLGMSESGIKKIMSGHDVSLQRLAEICEQAGIDPVDLLTVSWKSAPVPFRFNERQIAFFERHPNYRNFHTALLSLDLDLERLQADFELDPRSMRLYLDKLEELELISQRSDGSVVSAIPAPYRMGSSGASADQQLKHDFLSLTLREQTQGRRVFMAGMRMTVEHLEEFKQAIRDVIVEYGMIAHRDKLTLDERDLVDMGILAAMAPCRLLDYLPVPRL